MNTVKKHFSLTLFKVPTSSNLIYDLKKNTFKSTSYYTIKKLVENKKLQSLDEACNGSQIFLMIL